MSIFLISALLLNFGAMTGAMVSSTPYASRSSATHSVAGFLVPLATIAGFAAIALFLYDQGVGYGLLWWAASSFLFAAIGFRLMDGLNSTLGLVSIITGVILGIFAFS